MHVSMHICMYVYMYVCMYVCMHVCMYACMYVCIYGWMDGWICTSLALENSLDAFYSNQVLKSLFITAPYPVNTNTVAPKIGTVRMGPKTKAAIFPTKTPTVLIKFH
jgi:hypothetical protein